MMDQTGNITPSQLVDENASPEDFTTGQDPELDLLEKGITVAYNAALARLTSIPAATLYNRLCQWTRWKKGLEDGWIYYTAASYTYDTGFSTNTFTKAYRELVDAGLIEQKTTYIRMTRIKACHFRVTQKSPRDLYLERKNGGSSLPKFGQDRAHKFGQSIYTEEQTEEHVKLNITSMKSPSSVGSQPSPSAQAVAQTPTASTLSPSPSLFPGSEDNGEAVKEEGGVVKITTPPTMVDMKKHQNANDKRKKEFEFCQELLNRMGAVGVKAGGVFHKRIMQLKAQGYDDETLRQVANEAKTARLKEDFYAEPMKAFSESGVSGLIARQEKRKAKRSGGWSEMERQGYYV